VTVSELEKTAPAARRGFEFTTETLNRNATLIKMGYFINRVRKRDIYSCFMILILECLGPRMGIPS